MQKTFVLLALILLTSCSTIDYKPTISLQTCPKTIKKSVQMEKLVNKCPATDSIDPSMGLAITSRKYMPSDLDLALTHEIMNDFNNNALFSHISKRTDNPDLYIRGEINGFYGKSGMTTFGRVSYYLAMGSVIAVAATNQPLFFLGCAPFYSAFLGVPLGYNESGISITLRIYDKDNKLLGTYTATEKVYESQSIYENQMALSNLTNQTLTKVMQQIRDKILADEGKF